MTYNIKYKERDENKRSEFREKISAIPSKSLVFVDETGIDSYIYREFGRAPKGQKTYGKISGKRYKKTSIVAGKCGKEIVAPLQYDGTMDSKLFEFWMENMLLKTIKRWSVIVMDDAKFHRAKAL